MKTKLLVTFTLALLLGLMLSLAMVYAQGPDREVSEEEEGGDINSMGLADPWPLPGYSVLYMFTGVANDDSTPDNNRATSVHCTNFGSTFTTVGIQFFKSDGAIVGYSPYTDTLAPGRTGTYSTQPTFFGAEVPLNTHIIEQGSGRVLVNGHSQVICTAQILQPGNDITPTFMARLPMFDGSGNLVSSVPQSVFLPLILK
jgi:hypothetical protein